MSFPLSWSRETPLLWTDKIPIRLIMFNNVQTRYRNLCRIQSIKNRLRKYDGLYFFFSCKLFKPLKVILLHSLRTFKILQSKKKREGEYLSKI